MQLASICIGRQLTDAQMAADRGVYSPSLAAGKRLAAILSEAVPIWMEATTLLQSDDDSSLGAVDAGCCMHSNKMRASSLTSDGEGINKLVNIRTIMEFKSKKGRFSFFFFFVSTKSLKHRHAISGNESSLRVVENVESCREILAILSSPSQGLSVL